MSTFVPFVSDDEIVAIGRGLATRTLPKSDWTHAAHFAAALWLLPFHPEIDATQMMPKLIRAYNQATIYPGRSRLPGGGCIPIRDL
jgi:GMP synthase-like glutamine amidotransferase